MVSILAHCTVVYPVVFAVFRLQTTKLLNCFRNIWILLKDMKKVLILQILITMLLFLYREINANGPTVSTLTVNGCHHSSDSAIDHLEHVQVISIFLFWETNETLYYVLLTDTVLLMILLSKLLGTNMNWKLFAWLKWIFLLLYYCVENLHVHRKNISQPLSFISADCSIVMIMFCWSL